MTQRPDSPQHSVAMLSVLEFHSTFGLPVNTDPTARVDGDLGKLRIDLLEEEVGEFADATNARI